MVSMKLRLGFVSNSSSTSFSIMCKGEPTEEMFRTALGIEKRSMLSGWALDEFVEHCLEKDECFNFHECNSMEEYVGMHYDDDEEKKEDVEFGLEEMEEQSARYHKKDATNLDKWLGLEAVLLQEAFEKGWTVFNWNLMQGGEYGRPKPGYATDVDHIAALLGVNVHETFERKDKFYFHIKGP